jgi:hypothetical protein
MINDPSAQRVESDLNAIDFVAGCDARRWRIVSFAFPALDFVISATEPNGETSEYGFRADVSNFPTQAPLVRIWDHATNAPLAPDRRPKGGDRVRISFQHWPPSDTVYRPWDRMTGPHNNNSVAHPALAWRPDRHLTFIFEDLHGILNSNARAKRHRAST